MACWILSGTKENWDEGLKAGMWGVGENAKSVWKRVQPGDRVVFFVPQFGVLGCGTVKEKFVSKEVFWPDEKREGKVLWPYRLKIEVKKKFDRPRRRPREMPVSFAINKASSETCCEICEDKRLECMWVESLDELESIAKNFVFVQMQLVEGYAKFVRGDEVVEVKVEKSDPFSFIKTVKFVMKAMDFYRSNEFMARLRPKEPIFLTDELESEMKKYKWVYWIFSC